MKKLSVWAILTGSLILLAASSAFAQAPARPAGTSVAVVDINFIFKNHARFNQKMEEIKGEIENFERHLRDERDKITAKTEELQKIPAGSPQYKQLEESIASMHTTLSLETGRKRKEILENEAKVYYNAYREIEDHVALFADKYGIGLVLRFNSEEMDVTKRDSVLQGINRAVVFQRNLNITNAILEELNRETPPQRFSNQRPPAQPVVPGRPAVPR